MAELPLEFAPARRLDQKRIADQSAELLAQPLLRELLDCFPQPMALLNEYRQIVLANDKLAVLLGRPRESLVGLGPGEALNCSHREEAPGGCGTTRFCQMCGGLRAILKTQALGVAAVEECRITADADGGLTALDLRVWTKPLEFAPNLTAFAIQDISDEKRRQVLERVFVHDLLNTATSLRCLVGMLPETAGAKRDELTHMAGLLVERLVEAIESQRDLGAAERGELQVVLQEVNAEELLLELCAAYDGHVLAEDKRILAPQVIGSPSIRTDRVHLRRVLENLLKNALEASTDGQAVSLRFENHSRPTFYVHNEASMPQPVRLQVFQRSFSTKAGRGRGVGTYSVKLLTERYLGGQVDFVSSPEHGTTFRVILPASGDTP